jgi:hypothetical protein
MKMTNVNSEKGYYYNNLQWGPLHFFVSAKTGKRMIFRANEINSVRPDSFGPPVLTTVGGCEFEVTSLSPLGIR